jgi:hypothetical protein
MWTDNWLSFTLGKAHRADIGEGKVDLEHRRMAAPLREALAENEAVVAKAQRIRREG